MAENTVHVLLGTSFRLDQWDVDFPLSTPIGDVLPEVLKGLKIAVAPDDVSVLWAEGEREIKKEETPQDAGVKHGHSLNIELKPKTGTDAQKTVFISYSRRDREFLDRLRVHLKPLERSGVIDAWADDRIRVGDNWQDRITESLENAKVAVLLVSADFLASEFIVNDELPPILAAAEKEGTRVIPVILGYSRFTRDPSLNKFQAINDPNSPLVEQEESTRERIYDQIAQAIEHELADA